MDSARSIYLFALALVLLLGCSQAGHDASLDGSDASVDGSSLEESSKGAAGSPEARAIVARLESKLEASVKPAPSTTLPELPPSTSKLPNAAPIRLMREGGWLRVRAESPSQSHQAEVALPILAHEPFRIADTQTGPGAEIALRDASEVEAEIVDAQVIYRRAAFGGDVVHRPSALGTEDFILFDEAPPAGEKLEYDVKLDERVAGLRLVENTLELIDEGGAPRLRVAPPYVIDAAGKRHDATLSVQGCAVDTNPAAPWGRAPTPPGASQCTVQVAWGERSVSYPAIVDPAWTTARSMIVARYAHAPVLLATGKVLVVGGYSNIGSLATAELYDPVTDTWSATGSMTYARYEHTATRLGSGRVLVAGGNGSIVTTGATIYDPASGTWSLTSNNMANARYRHIAAPLEDGSVLLAGGYGSSGYLSTAELYLPATNTFMSPGSMSTARQYAKAVTLPNGKVLIAGGQGASSTYLNSAELYDPGTKAFTATPAFTNARAFHTMTLLASGKALLFGGNGNSGALGSPVLYDPTTNVWSPLGEPGFYQYHHTGTLLPDGKVLFAGGYYSSYLSRAVLYDPATNGFASTVSMLTTRGYHTATALPSGDVLIVGGYNNNYLASAELFRSPASCTQASECASGFCVDGYCCDSACDGGCGQCNRANSEGLCRAVVFGAAGEPSCSPYLCNGSSTSCPVSCTSNSQCVAGHFCNGSQCVPKLATGIACSSAAQCESGYCSDGFCCDAACSGSCDVCAASLGASANGTCTNLPDTAACGNYLCTGASGACPTSCATDANCAANAYCNASKVCVAKLANGTVCSASNQCSSGHCVDGRCCNDVCGSPCDRCDIAGWLGSCIAASAGTIGTPSCSPYVCNGASVNCPSSCTSDSQCATGHFCDGGSCILKRAKGETCNAATQCQSGYCVDGFCCDKACSGACEKCALSLGASADGICTSLPSGTPNCGNFLCTGTSGTCPTTCASDASCVSGRYCNASRLCVLKLAQGSSCTAGNQCVSGSCVDGVCCDKACAGGCDRCNLPGSVGTCANIPAGTVGANPSCGLFVCNGTSPSCPTSCTNDAQCLSTAACVGGVCVAKSGLGAFCSENRLCLSGFCSDGVCCNTACNGGDCDRCNLPGSAGTCRIAAFGSEGSPGSCAPYVCNGVSAACPSSCTGNTNCASGYACIAGSCEPKRSNGTSCVMGGDCQSGLCVDAVCCDTSCNGACDRCDLEGSKGACTPVPAKTPGQGCGLFLCDGKGTSCPTSCTENEACESGYCYAGQCYPKLPNGGACSAGDACESGFCVDGTCCESACDGQCARCDSQGALGSCQPVTGGPVGERPACGSDGTSCGGSCDGVNMAACSYPSTQTVCAAASCVGGEATQEARCDGAGACEVEKESCAPYACGTTSCLSTCESQADCSASAECVNGVCQGTLDNGAACVAAGECKAGFCVGGFCCQSACTGACEACNVAGSLGSCIPKADPSCDEAPWELATDDSGPCGCRVAGEKGEGRGSIAMGGLALALAIMRRRRAPSSGETGLSA